MASTTGSNPADQELRRRNVVAPSGSATSVVPADKPDTKKQQKPQQSVLQLLEEWEFLYAPIVFTFFAFFTRMYKIGISNIVTWDEAHFGKFGSHYLKREFYFDVHPPLGKILVGLSGYLAGYNGSFEFKSGEKYPEEVYYTFMRLFNAAFGALCVPLAYYTAKQLNFRKPTVWLVTLMVLCETSYATISRFILLDSMLLFFTFTTTLCWARFHRLQTKSFSTQWFLWLFLSGVSIGCVCSIKWVGLFVTLMVGAYTAEDLWHKFGDLDMPFFTFASHLGSRVVALIVVPFIVYALSFKAHFVILENSGPGDAQMSSLFQANLKGTEVGKDSPLEIAYGSRVTIKNMGYGGGLLHSHVQVYPEGSGQQQITCYHHKDANNDWFIYPDRFTNNNYTVDREADPVFIGDKEQIRFLHAQTGRNLHSHQVNAPVTKGDYEVACYGNSTVGDEKDHWIIEVVRDVASSDRSRIRALTTSFRLRHAALGCYLRAANVNLPQWGFKQIETTCAKKTHIRDIFTHWNFETHWNEALPPGNPGQFKSPFFRDFVHLNVAMMTSNNALVPDPDKQDDLASKWWQWPILNVGLRMCGWGDETIKYFLLGNPLVYWGSTAALGLVALLTAFYMLRWQRGWVDLKQAEIDHIHYSALYPVLGWFLHYLPFIAMGRVTYVHHYYPALWFAILAFGFVFDWVTRPLARKLPIVNLAVYAVTYAAIIGLFVFFAPFVFGMQGSSKNYSYMKLLKTWRVSDA